MSRSIFIQSGATLATDDASVNNPESVADGKVVLLGIDGEGQIGLGHQGLAPERFKIVRGVTGGLARRSGIIERDKVHNVTFKAYSAPVQQVTTITPVAGSVSEGTAGLKITRIDQGYEKFPRANYEIEVAAGDSTANIVTKFTSAINAAKAAKATINSPGQHVVTPSGTTTLILTGDVPSLHSIGTAKTEFVSFSTALTGPGTDGWTVAATTAPEPGSGTYGQVFAYENQSFGNKGFYYTEHYPQRPESHAVAGTTYDLLVLQVRTNADMAVNKSFMYHDYVIAVRAGEMSEEAVLGLFGRTVAEAESPSPS